MPLNLQSRRAKERERATQLRMQVLAEKAMARRLKKLITQAGRLAAKRFTTDGAAGIDRAMIQFEQAARHAFRASAKAIGYAFGRRLLESLGKNGHLKLETKAENDFLLAFDAWLSRHAALRVTQVTETTRIQLRRIVAAGGEAGLSADQIAREMKKRTSGQFAGYRAHRIARTEIHTAANKGSQYAADSTGLTLWKEWLSTSDGRTRSTHRHVNGQKRAQNEAFNVSGVNMQHPGDPAGGAKNVIMCRCAIGWLTEEPEDRGPSGEVPGRYSVRERFDNPNRRDVPSQQELEAVSLAAKDYTLTKGIETGFEHLVAVDLKTAHVLERLSDGSHNSVGFSSSLARRINNKHNRIELHHNHPGGRSLSKPDLEVAGLPGVETIYAHGHDGSIYMAKVARSHGFAARYNKALNKVIDALYGSGMPNDAIDAIGHHIVNSSLSRAGDIEYAAELSADKRELMNKYHNIITPLIDEVAGGLEV